VFLPGFEEGIFPLSRVAFNEQELEEERRLCYVGITRAKQKVYITSAAKRMQHGQTKSNPPSRFLGEIPAELLEHEVSEGSVRGSADLSKTAQAQKMSHRERLAAKRAENIPEAAMQANFGKSWDKSKILGKSKE
jgi:DNA helicase-2/ATP-dependent DNA helicase PcrA